eukprot:CRZ07061.1 hypothetical protein [Spongospora subterranea]
MRAFHHRNPCVIGTLAPGPYRTPFYGLICDGVHTHATAVAMAYHTHPEGAILVSDAISAMGDQHGPGTPTRLGTQSVEVGTKHAVIAGTNRLAGSVMKFDDGVRLFRNYTVCSQTEALEAASLHAAKFLNVHPRKGCLNLGSDADFIIVDDELNVLQTYIAGQLAWQRSINK